MKPENDVWPCTWEAHELEQLRYGRAMSFRQKLQWLEDMSDFAQRLQAAPTRALHEGQAVYGAAKPTAPEA